MRIGLGKDLHRLVKNRRFLIGGVEIPFKLGEAGHSDGDVLVHAIIDALLGAAAVGDIGEFFPPNDKKWENADSLELLRIVRTEIMSAGWEIINIDAVIECEEPKILPYRLEICTSLANILQISPKKIFIKGKTSEGLGYIGMKRAVSALVICLLSRSGL
ncbi:MAG: 2-C-methyl-D-erythritol 2,4-cyclodiphosphate synthase [Spirochaetaceae bacterium]|nr:2-C-methyl-D-erythritol 2,4-cyclodiphosphate synthase [Spirochaetaceae bacterium]